MGEALLCEQAPWSRLLLTHQNRPTSGTIDFQSRTLTCGEQKWDFHDLDNDPQFRRARHYAAFAKEHQKTTFYSKLLFDDLDPSHILSQMVCFHPDGAHISFSIDSTVPLHQCPSKAYLNFGIFNAVNDMVLITEAEPIHPPGPRIIFCNQAYSAMTQYSEKQLLGRTPRIMQFEETTELSKRNMRQAFERWEPITQVVRNRSRTGSVFDMELQIYPVADETGWFVYWLSIQRNITAEQVSTRNDKLASRLAATGMLASKLGHAINNPQMIVSSSLSMLVEDQGRLNEKQRDSLLQKAHDASDRVTKITRDLASLARSAAVETDLESFDVIACVTHALSVVDSLGSAAQAKASLAYDPSQSPFWALGDSSGVEHILLSGFIHMAEPCLQRQEADVTVLLEPIRERLAIALVVTTKAEMNDGLDGKWADSPWWAVSQGLAQSMAGELTLNINRFSVQLLLTLPTNEQM